MLVFATIENFVIKIKVHPEARIVLGMYLIYENLVQSFQYLYLDFLEVTNDIHIGDSLEACMLVVYAYYNEIHWLYSTKNFTHSRSSAPTLPK